MIVVPEVLKSVFTRFTMERGALPWILPATVKMLVGDAPTAPPADPASVIVPVAVVPLPPIVKLPGAVVRWKRCSQGR